MNELVQNFLKFSEKSFLCGDDVTAKPKLYNECVPYIDDESVFGWCSTRSYFNDSSMVGHYGNCDPGFELKTKAIRRFAKISQSWRSVLIVS